MSGRRCPRTRQFLSKACSQRNFYRKRIPVTERGTLRFVYTHGLSGTTRGSLTQDDWRALSYGLHRVLADNVGEKVTMTEAKFPLTHNPAWMTGKNTFSLTALRKIDYS